MRRYWWWLGLCLACSEDGRVAVTAPAENFYTQWAALESELGCTPFEEELPSDMADCVAEYSDWVTCVAQDLTQCYCEEDGDLNCEGSYKPNEGPALCIPEITVAEECRERAEAAELNLRWQDLAGAAGCEVDSDAFWPAESENSCAHFASDWLTCVASDASQCSCQGGAFSCDGSFDASLGPALCVREHEWLEICRE